MKPLRAIARGTVWLVRLIAIVSMAALALLTLVDVTGRYVLNFPVPGSVELTEILMVFAIFAGMFLASRRREHVSVDILTALLGAEARRWLALAGDAIGIVLFAVLAVMTWSRGLQAMTYAEQTTVLHIPLSFTIFFMSVALALNIPLLVHHMVAVLSGREQQQ